MDMKGFKLPPLALQCVEGIQKKMEECFPSISDSIGCS